MGFRYAAANGQEYAPGDFIEEKLKRDPDDLRVSEAYAKQWAAEAQDGHRGMANKLAADKAEYAAEQMRIAKQQAREAKQATADAASDAGSVDQGT